MNVSTILLLVAVLAASGGQSWLIGCPTDRLDTLA
jgi:hypothetical protein